MFHNEHDFFASAEIDDSGIQNLINQLRHRELPVRALVLHPRTVEDSFNDDGTMNEESCWGRMALKYYCPDPRDRRAVHDWVEKLQREIQIELGHSDGGPEVFFDLPTPPKFQDLQRQTFVKYADQDPILLDHIFPITSSVNSYAQQAKYRMYVFAWPDHREEVAVAAYKVLKRHKVQLNQEAFRLAKLNLDKVQELAKETIPKRRAHRRD